MKKPIPQMKNNNSSQNNQNKEIIKTQNEKSKKENFKILYSPYGYIKIEENEYLTKEKNLLKFTKINQKENKDQNILSGTINRNSIRENISISLKTFYGKRETYTFENINIFSPLSSLINNIIEREEELNINIENKIKKKEQYRIYSSRIKIHEIIPEKNYYENYILNREKLIILPQKKILFSETMKGLNIILSKNNTIASKSNRDDPQYIMADYPIYFGKHYFEITLHTEPYEKSVIIGIATKREPKNLFSYDVHSFHGFILSELKKISSINGKIEQSDFGDVSKINDKIGVLIVFNSDGVDLGFYINKIFIGNAFCKLNANLVYFPAVALGLAGTKISISNDMEFP